jgi:SEC-C motif domain protein
MSANENDKDLNSMNCPCTSGKQYLECCGIYHQGKDRPPTAEALMRSRYSAYAVGEIEYLLKTIPLLERKHFDLKAAKQWSSESEWTGLEILSTKESSDGTKATIEFKARFKVQEEEHEHAERAYFQKTQGRWFFLDGKILESK